MPDSKTKRTYDQDTLAIPGLRLEPGESAHPASKSGQKRAARYDDLVDIGVSLVEASRLTCRFHYQISRKDGDETATLLTKGFTVHACVNREGSLTAFPKPIKEAIGLILAKQIDSAR